MTLLLIVTVGYLLMGFLWASILYMEMCPLGNWKEHTTYWTINSLLWPMMLGLIGVIVLFELENQKE